MHRKRKDPYMTYGPSCARFMSEKNIGRMIIFGDGERAQFVADRHAYSPQYKSAMMKPKLGMANG